MDVSRGRRRDYVMCPAIRSYPRCMRSASVWYLTAFFLPIRLLDARNLERALFFYYHPVWSTLPAVVLNDGFTTSTPCFLSSPSYGSLVSFQQTFPFMFLNQTSPSPNLCFGREELRLSCLGLEVPPKRNNSQVLVDNRNFVAVHL
jgi:hypothetical protein